MSLNAALRLSWERLSAEAEAGRRRDARQMLELMVACQGDEKSWERQRERLVKILKS